MPAEPIHRDLDKEFGRITPAPNSVPVNHDSTYKAGTALVQTEYRTRVSFRKLEPITSLNSNEMDGVLIQNEPSTKCERNRM